MLFLTLLIQPVLSWQKQRQFINIQSIFHVITVFPDKTSVLSVLSDRSIPDHITILMNRIHVKNKKTARVQIIIDQSKDIFQIFLICQIIHAVTDTDHSTNRTIKFKILHILQQIQNIMSGFRTLLHCLCKHFLRIINSDHIISRIRKHLCDRSRPTSKFQNQTILDLLLFQCFYNIVCPFPIIYIILKHIINSGKFSI